MALGAERRWVVAMMLRSTLFPLTVGVAIGILVALVDGGLLSRQLYRVTSHDPTVMVSAVVALLLAGTLAAIVPAFRAASIDPLRALRTE